jgi:site-specific DNA-methyltransferase (adenine-specific)
MTLAHDLKDIQLHIGDCREVMRGMEAESVTAIVTDPPYALTANKKGGTGEASLNLNSPAGRFRISTGGGFMGKEWDAAIPGVEFWTEALRVAKPGAPLLAFGGTRTFHRLTCAIEDAGWEIRDCLMFLHAQGFPKSHDISKAIDKAAGAERERVPGGQGGANAILGFRKSGEAISGEAITPAARTWDGWGTSLAPSYEPIILAMKPLDGTYAQNALRHGVAGINVDGGRIKRDPDDVSGWSVTGSKASENRSMSGGNYERAPKPDHEGRWPKNTALDEQAARMLDEMSGERRSAGLYPSESQGTGKGTTYPGKRPQGQLFNDSGGASRFFFTAKASKADRTSGGWADNSHPTVKPTDLMRWLIRLVSMPENNLILDPFAGSGSTLVAAREEHVRAIGIDLDPEHIEIARRRLSEPTLPFNL